MDYRNPNYSEIYAKRAAHLARLRADPNLLAACHVHYKNNPWDFVNDWGMTFDPRNIERHLPASIPFVLFPKQIEFLKWLHERWRNGTPGLVEKSRDFGATWLCGAYAVAMWRYHDGFTVGFGSRKEELVDKNGDPKTIFEKIRFFINNLPTEFRPKLYDQGKHSAFMRIINPDNGATITGEAGDNIGRGGRQSVYFVDESAFIQRQDAKDAALSQNTNCQIDISTPNGNGNAFYRKRMSGKVPVFIMDWKDDPRKDKAWYEKQKAELDELIVAQEIDRDYNASQENVFIPAKWVNACVDAHRKLGWEPSGMKSVVFDPADVGDARGLIVRHGNVITLANEIKIGDIRDALPVVRDVLTRSGTIDQFVYDADGMGAPIIKLAIEDDLKCRNVPCVDYHGGGEKVDPDQRNELLGRTNAEAFANRRAQDWYAIRTKCENTYNAIEKGVYTNPSDMISFDSQKIDSRTLENMKAELSRPQRKYDGAGKIRVESKAEMKSRGVSSPNLADCVAMSENKPKKAASWDELPDLYEAYRV